MKRALSLLTLAAPVFGAYTYYYTDTLASLNLSAWIQNGSVVVSSGLSAPTAEGGSRSSTGSNLYQGRTTRVTDPAGKWKMFTTDAMVNRVRLPIEETGLRLRRPGNVPSPTNSELPAGRPEGGRADNTARV